MPSAITPSAPCTAHIDMQFHAGLWSHVPDIRWADGVKSKRGIPGNDPSERLGGIGTLQFSLDNSEHNSVRKVGYYAREHINRRQGFGLNTPVRLRFRYVGGDVIRWVGKLSSIAPSSGALGQRKTVCTALDWFNEASKHGLDGIPTQSGVRASDVITAILANMSNQPPGGYILDAGSDVYRYALDNTQDESNTAYVEFGRLSRSELGQIYLNAESQFVFESRYRRLANVENLVTFRGTHERVDAKLSYDSMINLMRLTVHPRTVDLTTDRVLFTLRSPLYLAAGQSLTMSGTYSDPGSQTRRIGGLNMIAPVAVTDYTANELSGGAGADLTADFVIVASYGGNSVRYTITNNSTSGGYVVFLRARGTAVYDYEPNIIERRNQTSIDDFGMNPIDIDMHYQDNVSVGAAMADYYLQLYGDERSSVASVTFAAQLSDYHMHHALNREISDRVGIVDSVTGLSNLRGDGKFISYHINSVEYDIFPNIIRCTWKLSLADPQSYWILGVTGRSELDSTTIVGP